MKPQNWLLVTGAPRSGTTFVGRVLSTPWSVDYIHEPFNPDCGMPGVNAKYIYVEPGAPPEARYREMIGRLLRYDFTLRTAFYRRDSPSRRVIKGIVGSRGPFYLRMAKLNPFHRTAIVKDPIGGLLTEYLTRQFDFRAIVLIRHPVAFVASVRRLGWDVERDLEALRAQEVVRTRFFSEEEELISRPGSRVEGAAVLWRALNKAILQQVDGNTRVRLVRHEDVSVDPRGAFTDLYRFAEIEWSRRAAARVARLTAVSNPTEARNGRVQAFARNSRALLEMRLRELNADERRTVYEVTRDVAAPLYSESSFAI